MHYINKDHNNNNLNKARFDNVGGFVDIRSQRKQHSQEICTPLLSSTDIPRHELSSRNTLPTSVSEELHISKTDMNPQQENALSEGIYNALLSTDVLKQELRSRNTLPTNISEGLTIFKNYINQEQENALSEGIYNALLSTDVLRHELRSRNTLPIGASEGLRILKNGMNPQQQQELSDATRLYVRYYKTSLDHDTIEKLMQLPADMRNTTLQILVLAHNSLPTDKELRGKLSNAYRLCIHHQNKSVLDNDDIDELMQLPPSERIKGLKVKAIAPSMNTQNKHAIKNLYNRFSMMPLEKEKLDTLSNIQSKPYRLKLIELFIKIKKQHPLPLSH